MSQNSLKIVHMSTYPVGGAGVACLRLHSGLLQLGIDSKVLVKFNSEDHKIPAVYEANNKLPLLQKVRAKAEYILRSRERQIASDLLKKKGLRFSLMDNPYGKVEHPVLEEADIINLHWVSGFTDFSYFFRKYKRKSIVWTLHDMAPFTGGYHYSNGFTGYERDELDCPFTADTAYPGLAAKELKKKIKVLQETKPDLTIVSPSNWLSGCSSRSAAFKHFPHAVIPNGLNSDIFVPVNQEEARKMLGLPLDKEIVLFVSDSFHDERKGFRILAEALPFLSKSYIIASVGNVFDFPGLEFEKIVSFGKIQDEKRMALIYAAADVFVIPSKEDNLPNVVIEALCCGTPVIGFNIGGMPDMVINNRNGKLIDEIVPERLAEGITSFFNEKNKFCRKSIASEAHSKYDFKVQGKNYLRLYQQIIGVKS